MSGASRLGAILATAVAAVSFAPSAGAAPTTLSAARTKAARLESQIENQGEQLSLANERFDESRYKIGVLTRQLAATKVKLAATERRYGALRLQIGKRARNLYMHPGAPLDAWFNMRSLDQTGRQRVLSDAVLTADANLINETNNARRDIRAKERALDQLNADAQNTQQAIASEQRDLMQTLRGQRALLSSVRGDIARIIAADRARALAAARHGGGPGAHVAYSEANIPPPPPPKAGASTAVAVARAQIGKPYKWGAAGPDRFDCSGLTMYAWAKVGVQLVHFAASQYDMLPKVRRSQLAAGDLVFFGSPIHHVGIYEGGGIMIDAPQTGENVRRDSIYRDDYAGASRP